MKHCRTQTYKMVEVNTEIETEVEFDEEDFNAYLDNAYDGDGFGLLNDLVEEERISFQDISKFLKEVGYSVEVPKMEVETPKEHQCCGGLHQHNQPGPTQQYSFLDPTNPEHLEAIIKAITKQLMG